MTCSHACREQMMYRKRWICEKKIKKWQAVTSKE